jgi:hypothetical protein
MKRLGAVVVAVALGLAGAAWAQQGGQAGGNSPGEGRWNGSQSSGGDAKGTDPGTFSQDPTGMSGQESRVSGAIYGSTRGPGANPIQVDRANPYAYPAPAKGGATANTGHVPTDQELAKGAPPAIVDLPPLR